MGFIFLIFTNAYPPDNMNLTKGMYDENRKGDVRMRHILIVVDGSSWVIRNKNDFD